MKPGHFVRGKFRRMNQAPKLTTYRLDDLPLVLGLLMQMNLPEIFDREIQDHGLHTGLSGGWMMTIWLAFIITRSDHTKYNVETWLERHQEVIAMLTGQVIIPQEFIRLRFVDASIWPSLRGSSDVHA